MARQSPPGEPVEWTGAEGPAGASALRAHLALACISRRPLHVTWPAESPGLDAEGAAAVEVARVISNGAVEGGGTGARSLELRPGAVKPGTLAVDVGAQSAGPLVQMAAVPLALAGGASTLRLTGLTHAPGARSFHDVAYGWLPLAERTGIALELSLGCAGFDGDEPGIVEARVFAAPRLHGLELGARGLLVETQAIALVANLGIGIALPLERRLGDRLRAAGIAAQVEVLPLPAVKARGLAALVVAQFERFRTAVVRVGQAGHPAEEVADEAVAGLQALLARRGALPGPVAEELLLPLAVAASPLGAPGVIGKDPPVPSRITTAEVTPSLLAVADAIRRFLPVEIQIQGLPGEDGAVEIRPAP